MSDQSKTTTPESDTLDLTGLTDREVLLKAPSYQGGHSRVGSKIADRLAIPFPVSMEHLAKAALERDFDPDELWPWWAEMRQQRAAMEATDTGVILRRDDLHLIRQWFENVEDCNPAYLEAKDYRLAVHVYQALGWPVTQRVREGSEK